MTGKRSDATLEIDGKSYLLRLTLGALSDIEEKLGTENLDSLTCRLSNPSMQEIFFILSALIKAGGQVLDETTLLHADINITDVMKAIAKAFSAALSSEVPGKQ